MDASPVVLVNLLTFAASDVAALLKAWEADANWMKPSHADGGMTQSAGRPTLQ